MEDKLELYMELHNNMLNDHLDMKDQSMMVDYEMVDLEYQPNCMLKDPNITNKGEKNN